MAIIHPYADPSAHGKVTPGLQFRRRGHQVVFGAAPRPRDKNSLAQQTQRAKIRQAVERYKVLNFEELTFLRRRGSMKSTNKYNLYTSSQLKNNDWSKVKGHPLQELNNLVIFDRQQDDLNNTLFELQCILSDAWPDNIVMYNKLDSETAGVVASEYGPDFTWSGTPSHIPARFDNGASSTSLANYLSAADNGVFFESIFSKHITAMWFKTTYDVTDGKPVVGGNKDLYDWVADKPIGNENRQSLTFNGATGLQFSAKVEGSLFSTVSNDPAITFLAGEEVFILVAYDRDGIDGTPETLQIWFGNEDTITQVQTSTQASGVNVRDAVNYRLLVNVTNNRKLDGTVDNIYTLDKVTNPTIQQQIAGRNIEQFKTELGNVYDNQNIFTAGDAVTFCPELRLKISNFDVFDWEVPFYWGLNVTWSNLTTDKRTTIIRLPRTVVNSSEAVEFWLSQDMSDYFDRGLYRLGGTDNV